MITCPAQEPIPNGEVQCTLDNAYGSVCVVVCNPGYEIDEDIQTTCQADHTWDNLLPSCNSKLK